MVIITAPDIKQFVAETGHHTIQRVPPTEKRGRVHTSSVIVTVLYERTIKTIWDQIQDSDFTYRLFSGTGSGGQHRNRKQCSVVMTHVPSGITQTCIGRSREDNLKNAKERLLEMIEDKKTQALHGMTNSDRVGQVKDGVRKRTYRFQNDEAIDHTNNKKIALKTFMRGNLEKIW